MRMTLACLAAVLGVPMQGALAGPLPLLAVAPAWSVVAGNLAEATETVISADGTRLFVAGPARAGTRYAASVSAYDTASGELEWRFRSRRTTSFPGCEVALSPDGSTLFLVGHTNVNGTRNDLVTWALNANTGASRWSARHDGTAHQGDRAGDVIVGPSGRRVYVTGTSWSRGLRDEDLVVVAYEAGSGARRWQRVYDSGYTGCQPSDGCWTGFEQGFTLALNADGSTLVVGGTQFFSTLVVAYRSATGERRWLRTYEDPASSGDASQYWSSSAVNDGTVFVAGGAQTDEGGEPRPMSASYDLATGERNWATTYDPPGLADGRWTSLRVASDGLSMFTAGAVRRSSQDVFTVVSYDAATGVLGWVSEAEVGHSADLALAPDGGILYAAGHRDEGSDSDLTIVGLDPSSGTPAWIGRHDAAAGDWERTRSVVIAPDGAAIFAVGATGTAYDERSALIVAFATD
jgi:hypothetical protein